jgi:hypothetical protein
LRQWPASPCVSCRIFQAFSRILLELRRAIVRDPLATAGDATNVEG